MSASAGGQNGASSRVASYAQAFGRFWWEFLVGDTPELFLATVLIVGLALALHPERILAIAVVLVAAVGSLGLSTWRGRVRTTQNE